MKWALCTIRSHGTKLYILVSKLRSGTFKTKAGPGELVRVALFWKSHCVTCSPVYIILYHVTGSCKGPISSPKLFQKFSWLVLVFHFFFLFHVRLKVMHYLFFKIKHRFSGDSLLNSKKKEIWPFGY